MTTTIHSNGSKWAGEEPDSIETLLSILASHPLDRTFERYGNFVLEEKPGTTNFFGNFSNISHVFSINSDDNNVINRLTTAIRKNQQRHDYISQAAP